MRFVALPALLLLLAAPVHAEAPTAQSTAPAAAKPANQPPNLQGKLVEAAMKAMEGNLALMRDDTANGTKLMQEAIAGYGTVLAAEPENVAALNGRGMAADLLKDGSGKADLERAAQISSARIAKDGKDAIALHDRATSYRALNRYDLARADYQAAIALKPDRENWPLDLRAMEAEVKMRERLLAK